MSSSWIVTACLALTLNAPQLHDSSQDDDLFETREKAMASINAGFDDLDHQVEYRQGIQQKLVIWSTPFRGQNKCAVGVFEFDPNENAWRRTFKYLFEGTREIAVEFKRGNVRLRNDADELIYDDSREKRRFKGVELYSWKNDDGMWEFAMLDGTNRLKSAAEVKASPGRLRDAEALKQAIQRLAIGELVIWNPFDLAGFSLPDDMVRSEVLKSAKQAGIQLELD